MRASDRGALALLVAGAVVASVTGCESFGGSALPEVPLWVHHPGAALALGYRSQLSAEARTSGEAYERGRPEVDAAHRRVFVGSSDRGLYALRAEDGTRLWRFETLGAVQSEPLYDPVEDVVYFGSNDGALYKLRASDGELLFRFATNAEVARKPVLKDGVLYVTNANDTVLAIDAKTGATRWTQHRTPAFGMEIAGYAGPCVHGDKLFAGFSDGVVTAYSLTDGAERWTPVDLAAEAEQAAGGEPPRYLDVDTTPIAVGTSSGDVIVVGSYEAGVYALDAESGARAWAVEEAKGATDLVLWTQPAYAPRGAEGPSVPEKKVLLVSSGPTGLWGLDPENGTVLWRRKLPEGGISAPVPFAGALLVTASDYGIFLFSPLDGGNIDGIATGGGIAMTPAAFGTKAFVLSNTGVFMGLTIRPPDVALRPKG
jgi:outer membrane protein assembly factor BamB